MKKLLSVCFSILFFLTGCGNSERDFAQDGMIVYTNAGYPPFEMFDEKGKLFGMDIDIIQRVSEITGYPIKELKHVDFNTLPDSLLTKKCDLVIAGINPTSRRAKVVDFTDYYYVGGDEMDNAANYVVVLEESEIYSADDLKGKKAGVQMGTSQESTLMDLADTYKLKVDARQNYADLFLEVQNKKIDFIVLEKAVAENFMKQMKGFRTFELGVGVNPEGYAMMVPKGSSLQDDVNVALNQMKESGELNQIIEKWMTWNEEHGDEYGE